MTHDERAKLIKRIFMPLLIAAIVAGVWFYPKPAAKVAPEKPVTTSPENGLLIVLHRLPGDPASEQTAEILNRVQTKYGKLIIVSEVDFKLHPEVSKAQGVTSAPHVVIISGKDKVFDFHGPWTQAQVEYKVDQILRGLKSVGKDWRPPVPGMKPAGS
jgi:hypothetical protein